MSLFDTIRNLKGILSDDSPRNKMKRVEGAIRKMQNTKGAPRKGGGSPADIPNTVDKNNRPAYVNKSVDVGNAVPGERAVKKKQDTPSIHVSKNTPSRLNRMDTNRKATKVNTKKDTIKNNTEKPRKHYATEMAKRLVGGPKRY